MLTFPPDPTPFRIVGVDPGTDTLGAATLDVYLGTTGQVCLVEVRTFSGEQLARHYRHVEDIHGSRVARLLAHEDNLHGYFCYTQPHCIISESPYLGRFPQAYAALTECVGSIRRAVMRYNAFMPLLLIDPPTVKLAVGVKGRGTTKDDVKQGLKQLIASGKLDNPFQVDIDALDEHSVDAIVVAYVRAAQLIEDF